MYGYIYKTTNLVNDKIYIGQKHSDKFLENDYLGSGKLLKQAIKKYGEDSFKVELIEECETKEQLNKREIYWIEYYNSTNKEIGYNISFGGDGGDTLKNLPIDKKIARNLKVSNSLTNRVWIYNDNKEQIKVKREFVDKYLENGYHLGYKYKKKRTKESYLKQSKTQTKIHLDESTIINIINCYKNGDSISTLSKTFSLNTNYIRRLLKDRGVHMRNIKEATILYHKNFVISNATREKMSKQRKGKPKTKEWCKKISSSNKGKVVKNETRQKLKKYFSGRVWVNRGCERHQILKADVDAYLNMGFSLGIGKRNK